ncbi:MAG: hypothetical protein ACR2MS_02585 [Weeksellaceae bacterium]
MAAKKTNSTKLSNLTKGARFKLSKGKENSPAYTLNKTYEYVRPTKEGKIVCLVLSEEDVVDSIIFKASTRVVQELYKIRIKRSDLRNIIQEIDEDRDILAALNNHDPNTWDYYLTGNKGFDSFTNKEVEVEINNYFASNSSEYLGFGYFDFIDSYSDYIENYHELTEIMDELDEDVDDNIFYIEVLPE